MPPPTETDASPEDRPTTEVRREVRQFFAEQEDWLTDVLEAGAPTRTGLPIRAKVSERFPRWVGPSLTCAETVFTHFFTDR
jgi:hypothetical protein